MTIKTKSFELAINIAGDEKSSRMAILLPGRLDSKDYGCFQSHLDLFAGLGYYVVCFDPPGTWKSRGDVSLYTTTNYIQAVAEVIEYFGDKQTVLMGHSRGGEVAILSGVENPHVVGLVLINASFGSPTPPQPEELIDGMVLEKRDLPPGDKVSEEQKVFHLPLEYFTDGQKYDSVSLIKNCSKPKLIFYSLGDQFNDKSDIEEIFGSLPEPKELIFLEGKHDYRYFPEVVEKINQITSKFLQNNSLI